MNTKLNKLLPRIGVSALIVLLVAACSMEGDVSDGGRNKMMVCKDFRDGETFSFNTNTIKNVRIGIVAPTTFDVVTVDGKAKTLSSEMVPWLKCNKSN